MRRVGGFLSVVLALVLAGCGGSGGDGGRTDGGPPATSATSPSASATPYDLTEGTASRAIRAVEAPAGFGTPVRCPGAKGCTAPDKSMEWGRSTKYDGKAIPGGNGFRSLIYVFVTQYRSPGRAEAVAQQVARGEGVYDGTFDRPIKQDSGNGYLPGEKGRGTVSDLTRDGWSGVYRDARFTYSFTDHPDSGPVHAERAFLTRGPWAISLYSTRPGATPKTIPGLLDELLPALGS